MVGLAELSGRFGCRRCHRERVEQRARVGRRLPRLCRNVSLQRYGRSGRGEAESSASGDQADLSGATSAKSTATPAQMSRTRRMDRCARRFRASSSVRVV